LSNDISAAIKNRQALFKFVLFRLDPGRQNRANLLVKQPEIVHGFGFQFELLRRHAIALQFHFTGQMNNSATDVIQVEC